jgi:hypothetical protein
MPPLKAISASADHYQSDSGAFALRCHLKAVSLVPDFSGTSESDQNHYL